MTFPSSAVSPAGWRLEHSYAQLPQLFHRAVLPGPVKNPEMVLFNDSLAASLGLDAGALRGPAGAAIFAGNDLPPGGRPIAQAYAGHQYGHFTTLGDGRAILLGEQITPAGERRDIQLKGAGPTPFSRGGDGRAALGPMLREYIISEAMHALGIPTTRSLAVVTTGEQVYRGERLAGAVLTRVAASHIRVGTMEWAASCVDAGALRELAGYTLRRHYPDQADPAEPGTALLSAVMESQAGLIARWQHAGFVHGVMNTDNMALSGETIDYGPCAFMDAYDPATVFSSIDSRGRYAYGNQPAIAQWNLARLAEALLPLLHPVEELAVERANEIIQRYPSRFEYHWLAGMRKKLGLFTEESGDRELIEDLMKRMAQVKADYTNTFAALAPATLPEDASLREWHRRWLDRLAAQPQPLSHALELMRAANPVVIPRNHRVEEALAAAVNSGDFAPLHRLLEVLARPFDCPPSAADYQLPPPAGSCLYQTFCGT